MTFMDETVWRGKTDSGGGVTGSGGDAPVIEPATGARWAGPGWAGPGWSGPGWAGPGWPDRPTWPSPRRRRAARLGRAPSYRTVRLPAPGR